MLGSVSVIALPLVFTGFLSSYALALFDAWVRRGFLSALLSLFLFATSAAGALLLGVSLFEVAGYLLPLLIIDLLSFRIGKEGK